MWGNHPKLEKKEAERKAQNPDFDDLFGIQPEKPAEEVEAKPEAESLEQDEEELKKEIDPRNQEVGIGFIDCMGYKIRVKDGDTKTNPWQNLWMRFATDKDRKHDLVKGQNSRFYKFNLIQRNKYRRPNPNDPFKSMSKNKDFEKKKFDRK